MKKQTDCLNRTNPRRSVLQKWKNLSQLFLASVLILVIVLPGYAQQKKTESIGTVGAFYQSLKPSASNNAKIVSSKKSVKVKSGEALNVSFHNNRQTVAGEVFIGKVDKNKNSFAFFTFKNGSVTGKVILPDQKKAYVYSTEKGTVWVTPEDIHKVMCIESEQIQAVAPSSGITTQAAPPPGSYAYNLQSLPGATAVVMLDFDGHDATGSYWGNIIAQPANVSESDIEEAWRIVSEDFSIYDLNVTTNEAVYQAAPVDRRMRCIITPTTDAAPGWGGVAFVGSFTLGGELAPCWVFNGAWSDGTGGKISGETCSHEVGHTVGLWHDGRVFPDGTAEEYYYGQGNWAPIMGASFYPPVTHWTKGEYQYASNTWQDDIEIIGTANGFGFKPDDIADNTATTKGLVISAFGDISAASNYGIIGNRTDVDYFYFDTQGGLLNLTVGGNAFTNLDVGLTLLNSTASVVATADPANDLTATLYTYLGPGRYYLVVDGVGQGNPLVDGYTDYSSIGEYKISGSLTPLPTGCLLEQHTPSAWQFQLRNAYWDQSSGSFVTNECDALKVVHRDYGKQDLWVVQQDVQIQVISGQAYTVKMDFKDFAEFGISGIEVGFATGMMSGGDTQPALVGSTVSFPSGYSGCNYTNKSVTITASYTGQVHLAFKFIWPAQPPVKVATFIKDLSVCPVTGSGSFAASVPPALPIPSYQPGCLINQPNPSAPAFILRNDYWDQSSGSYVANECDALKIVHHEFGKDDLWMIQTGVPIQVVAGQTYTIKMDFKDFAAQWLSGIEAGFATGILSYETQPSLMGTLVSFPAGTSFCGFTTKSVNIMAAASGTVYLTFKFKWYSQPQTKISLFIKNLSVCPGAGSSSKIALNEITSELIPMACMVSPNPTESDFTLSPQRTVTHLSVQDLQGKLVYSRDIIIKDDQLKFGENFTLGFYIVSLRYEDGSRESFKIVKTK